MELPWNGFIGRVQLLGSDSSMFPFVLITKSDKIWVEHLLPEVLQTYTVGCVRRVPEG